MGEIREENLEEKTHASCLSNWINGNNILWLGDIGNRRRYYKLDFGHTEFKLPLRYASIYIS